MRHRPLASLVLGMLPILVSCSLGKPSSSKVSFTSPQEQQAILNHGPLLPAGYTSRSDSAEALPPSDGGSSGAKVSFLPRDPELRPLLSAKNLPQTVVAVPSASSNAANGPSSVLNVSGTLLSYGDSKPISGAAVTVSATLDSNGSVLGSYPATTDSSGAYQISIPLDALMDSPPPGITLDLMTCASAVDQHQNGCQPGSAFVPTGASFAHVYSAHIQPLTLIYNLPAAPVTVSPSGIASLAAISFNWKPVSSASTYNLQVYDSVTRNIVTFNGISAPPYVPDPSKILPAHALAWAVQTVGSHGPGNWSPSVSVTFEDTPQPLAPGTSDVVTANGPTLSWSAVPGAQSYQLWISTFPTVLAISGTTYSLGVFNAGQTYRWEVRALYSDNAYGPWSSDGIFIPGVPQAKSPVGSLPVDSGTQQTLVAVPVPGITLYEFSAYDLTTGQTLFDTISPTGNTYTATFPEGDQIRWWVTAAKAGAWSAPATFSLAKVPAPQLSSPAQGNALGTLTPTFSWASVTGANGGYLVWVDDLTTRQNKVVFGTSSQTSFTSPKNLVPGHSYGWTVAAVDQSNIAGPWSSYSTFSISPVSDPQALSIAGCALTATTQCTTGNQPTFAWTPSSPSAATDSYLLYLFDRTPGSAGLVLKTEGVTETSYTLGITLQVGHTYSWTVQAASPATGFTSVGNDTMSFSVTQATNPVSLKGLGTLSFLPGVGQSFSLNASPSPTDGASYQYSAIVETQLYFLNHSLDLCFTGNYYQNSGGRNEKWLRGSACQGDWYFLLPDGTLNHWNKKPNNAQVPAAGDYTIQLSKDVYADPSLLFNATSNGSLVRAAAFMASLAKTSVTLSCNGPYYTNPVTGQKWLLASNGDWYTIFPDGTIEKWNNDPRDGIGQVITTLDPSVYNYPMRLCGSAGYTPPATAVVAGNGLTVTPSSSFTGTFYLEPAVKNGANESIALPSLCSVQNAN